MNTIFVFKLKIRVTLRCTLYYAMPQLSGFKRKQKGLETATKTVIMKVLTYVKTIKDRPFIEDIRNRNFIKLTSDLCDMDENEVRRYLQEANESDTQIGELVMNVHCFVTKLSDDSFVSRLPFHKCQQLTSDICKISLRSVQRCAQALEVSAVRVRAQRSSLKSSDIASVELVVREYYRRGVVPTVDNIYTYLTDELGFRGSVDIVAILLKHIKDQVAGETDGTTPSSSNFASTASTASCPPLEPVESVIIKEEVDVDDDYSANTSETSRHGDDMDFEGTYNDMEQTDPLEESRYISGDGNFEETDSKQGIAGSISAVKEDYVDKTDSASAVNNGLSTILRIADSLALDINNILTDDLIGFNDVNPTQPRGKTLSSSEKDPTLAEVKSKCSKLEQKLRIHYLKIMLKKEEELVDIKIAASKVYLQNAQMEAQQKMEAHLQKMENLKLEHRLLKLRLEKEAK